MKKRLIPNIGAAPGHRAGYRETTSLGVSLLCAGLLWAGPARAQSEPDASPKAPPATASTPIAKPDKAAVAAATPSTKKSTPAAWLDHAYTYSPPGCEFSVQFPEEPFKGQRCDPIEPTKNCKDTTSYTKVFGLDASVTYTVTCNAAPAEMYGQYDDNVMKTTLIAMAKPVNLDKFDTGFAPYKEAKMAVLLGSGKTDNKEDDLIYTAQLWIGHQSVFTLEGQLRGRYVPDADQLFAEILKTAKLKGTATLVDVDGKVVTSPAPATPHKTVTPAKAGIHG